MEQLLELRDIVDVVDDGADSSSTRSATASRWCGASEPMPSMSTSS